MLDAKNEETIWSNKGLIVTSKNESRLPLKIVSKIPETKNAPKNGTRLRFNPHASEALHFDKRAGAGRTKNKTANKTILAFESLKKEFKSMQKQ